MAGQGGRPPATSRTGPASSTLEALSGDAGRELLHALVGATTRSPRRWRRRILGPAEGNPFFLEELVRSLADAGRAPCATARDGASTTTAEVEIPPTVEKVILARIDRLGPDAHGAR